MVRSAHHPEPSRRTNANDPNEIYCEFNRGNQNPNVQNASLSVILSPEGRRLMPCLPLTFMKRGGVNVCGENIAEINYFVNRTIHGWQNTLIAIAVGAVS